jgi:hypothetical protein
LFITQPSFFGFSLLFFMNLRDSPCRMAGIDVYNTSHLF